MAGLEDAARLALGLPGASETVSRGRRQWRVDGRNFVWERPYTGADERRDGPPPPRELLGVRVADAGEKAALLAAEPGWFCTISHFDEHPMLLLRLAEVPTDRLAEIVQDAWLVVAPPAAREAWLAAP